MMELRSMRAATPASAAAAALPRAAPLPFPRGLAERTAGQRSAAPLGLVRAVQGYRAPQQQRVRARWHNGRPAADEGLFSEEEDDHLETYVSPYRPAIEEEDEEERLASGRQRQRLAWQRSAKKRGRSRQTGRGNGRLSPGALVATQQQVGAVVDCTVTAVRKHGVYVTFHVHPAAAAAVYPPPATPTAILAADDAAALPWDSFDGDTDEAREPQSGPFAQGGLAARETVTGLVPASELSWMDLERPCDMVASGQQLQAVITSVDLPLRRVQLSVRQAARSPLGTLRGPASQWRPGDGSSVDAGQSADAPRAKRKSIQELTESAIKLRSALSEHMSSEGAADLQELWWLEECRPVLRGLLRRAFNEPGGGELGQALALLEAAGDATSFQHAANVCLGGVVRGSKALARAVAANWEPTAVARMLAALPSSLEPFHQLLREFKMTRNETAIQMVVSELDRRYTVLEPDATTYRHIIAAYAAVGRVSEARKAFKGMRDSGVVPNVETCNALLGAIASESARDAARRKRKGQELPSGGAALKTFVRLSQLMYDGFLEQPDLVTYNILLKACSIDGDVNRAKAVLSWMRQDGLKPSVHTFTSLINIFESAAYADGLLQVAEMIEASGITPSRRTWSSIVTSCGRLGQLELAFVVWQKQIRVGPLPSVAEYNTLLQACEQCRQGSKALDVLKAMASAGHAPTLKTYALVLAALQSQTALKGGSRGAAEQVAAALELKEEIQASGLEGSAEIYSRLVSICTETGDYQAARQMAREMEQLGLPLDTICCTALIKGYGAAGWVDEAYDLYLRMRDGPPYMQPSRATYLALCSMCRQLDRLDVALQTYNEMRAAGFEPCDDEFKQLTEAVANKVVESSGDVDGDQRQALSHANADQAEALATGDMVIDLAGLSGAEARAAVLGVLQSVQMRYKSGAEIAGGLMLGAGDVSMDSSADLYSKVTQLLQDVQIATESTPSVQEQGNGPAPKSRVMVRISPDELMRWLSKKAQAQ